MAEVAAQAYNFVNRAWCPFVTAEIKTHYCYFIYLGHAVIEAETTHLVIALEEFLATACPLHAKTPLIVLCGLPEPALYS
jgi:hypothetical protein